MTHEYQHPRLRALITRARVKASAANKPPSIGLVYPCDALSIAAAASIAQEGIATPVLIGPPALIQASAHAASVAISNFEVIATQDHVEPIQQAKLAAIKAAQVAASGAVVALMKGSLHTDELMSAVIKPSSGLRSRLRISHAFVFDLPRYHKLLALADCVVNINPSVRTKRDILSNAITMLAQIGIDHPKVGIVAAIETVNPSIKATVDAAELVRLSHAGDWPGAMVEGPFGFDNVISAQAARVKNMASVVAGDADLLIMPDLNAGNILYKAFNYIGGGECAGLVLGTKVPIVLTSRSDSLLARTASAALAVLCVV
jgi:phosphate acetyltransferase